MPCLPTHDGYVILLSNSTPGRGALIADRLLSRDHMPAVGRRGHNRALRASMWAR
jgi:hypothetical protein